MDLYYKFIKKFKQNNVVTQLIYIIILVFIVQNLINTLLYFQQNSTHNIIINNFSLTSQKPYNFTVIYKLFTYSFLHANFIHLILNLMVLFYIGNLFIDYFSEKKLILYYLLGSLFGGIFFLFSFQYFDVIKNDVVYLMGASASITALMVGLATKAPNYELHFRFIGFVKLWIVTTIWLTLSIILIPNGNIGGQLSHLGGAFIGFLLTKYQFKVNVNTSKPKSANLKMVYKKNTDNKALTNFQKDRIKQNKIDAILDKISKSGYETLTKNEKDFLESVGKN